MLRESILFSQWSMDQLVKMAYAMKKRQYSKGTSLVRQGDRADFVYVVNKGKIAILKKMINQANKQITASNGITKGSSAEISVDIAELGPHDIFGLVELFGSSKKMKREAYALTTNVEVYLIQYVASINTIEPTIKKGCRM